MCRTSFEEVGSVLRDWVDDLGGAWVVSPGVVRERLREEFGYIIRDDEVVPSVEESAIEHFALSLRSKGLKTEPIGTTCAMCSIDGNKDAVVVIYNATSYPHGVYEVSDRQVDPTLEPSVIDGILIAVSVMT